MTTVDPWSDICRSNGERAGAGSSIGSVLGTLAAVCVAVLPGTVHILETEVLNPRILASIAASGAVLGALAGALLGMALIDPPRAERALPFSPRH